MFLYGEFTMIYFDISLATILICGTMSVVLVGYLFVVYRLYPEYW